jgi:hypothetical protein
MFRRRTTPARGDAGYEAGYDSGSVVERDEAVRPGHAWSPAQIVAFLIGAASLAFGIVALVRTGLDLGDLTGPEDTVLGFTHTPLLALVEIGFGALMLLAALSPGGRVLMAFLGAVALAFGILILADAWPGRFQDWFAVDDDNGWLYVVVGGVSLLAALLLPTVHTRDRRHVTERRRIGDPHAVH